MNWVDGLIVVILLYNVLTGFFKGFVRSLLGLAALVLSTLAAGRFADQGAALVGMSARNNEMGRLVGAAVVGTVVWVALSLAGYFLARLVRRSGLRGGDRWAGGVLGLAVGLMTALVPLAFIDDAPILKPAAPLALPQDLQGFQNLGAVEESRQQVVHAVADTRAHSLLWRALTPLEPPVKALTRLVFGWPMQAGGPVREPAAPAAPGGKPAHPARPAAARGEPAGKKPAKTHPTAAAE